MHSVLSSLLTVATVFSLSHVAHAQWGALKGRVVISGEVAEVKPLFKKDMAPKDNPVCGVVDMPDDSLVIDPESKGLANALVWLVNKPKQIHPNLEKPADVTFDFDNVKCRFEPHVLIIRAGQQVRLLNDDSIGHNTNFVASRGVGFNPQLAPNDRVGDLRLIETAEKLPASITCGSHAWMKAHWLIVDHPYAAITDKQGRFEIKDIPAGDHEYRIWHENAGYLVADPKNKRKGLMAEIKSDETRELPDLKIPLDKVKPQ